MNCIYLCRASNEVLKEMPNKVESSNESTVDVIEIMTQKLPQNAVKCLIPVLSTMNTSEKQGNSIEKVQRVY